MLVFSVAVAGESSNPIREKPPEALLSSASTSNLVIVNPSNITNLPVKTEFNVTVLVANMQYILGWDLYVETDPSVINPLSISFDGNLFENQSITNPPITPLLVSNCVNLNPKDAGCVYPPNGLDGPGVAHSAGTSPFGTKPNITSPINGTLFVITYNVTSSTGFTSIQILNHSAMFADGTGNPIPVTLQDGVYGKQLLPDFGVSLNPDTVNVIQGSNVTTKVVVDSIQQFAGKVNLGVVSQVLGFVISNQTLTVPPSGSASSNLTIITSNSTAALTYSLTVFASNGTSSRSASLSVNVELPGSFRLAVSPGLLRIHAGDGANTTVTLYSEHGFSGTVDLNFTVYTCTQGNPRCTPVNATILGPIVALGSRNILLRPGWVWSTSLNVSTPVTSILFIYRIDVVARSASLSTTPQVLWVTAPPSSLSTTIDPSPLNIRAGNTAIAKINVWSVDYFWGWVYVSAVISGGTARFDQTFYHIEVPSSAHLSYTPSAKFSLSVTFYGDARPGNYVILLTVYSVETIPITLPDSAKIAGVIPLQIQVGIPVTVSNPSLYHVSPPEVFGLAPLIYFTLLGALVVPFAILTVRAVRNYQEDREDPDWKL